MLFLMIGREGICSFSVYFKILENIEVKYMNFEIGLCILNLNYVIY